MKDKRDMRDPTALGEAYLRARGFTDPRIIAAQIEFAVQVPVKNYEDGGFISSDPAHHHSKTPQTLGDLDTGGGS